MILQTAINHYGVEHQLNKVDEELKELLEAVDNWRDDRTKVFELIDEIADVKIMIQQLEIMLVPYHPDLYSAISDRLFFKLERLKQRIEDDKNRHGV